jgi:hypothetical protein
VQRVARLGRDRKREAVEFVKSGAEVYRQV